MSKSNRSLYSKRNPKHSKELSSAGVHPFCGMVCCGITGKPAKKKIRSFRNAEKKEAIKNGLHDWEEK